MTLRALVVFESMFGNTEKVAAAVAHGLQLEGIDTGLLEVHAAPATLSPDVDLLVVGAPTHAFSMSRVSTREDAVRQGARPSARPSGLREWLGGRPVRRGAAPALATFDTRVTRGALAAARRRHLGHTGSVTIAAWRRWTSRSDSWSRTSAGPSSTASSSVRWRGTPSSASSWWIGWRRVETGYGPRDRG